MSWCCNAFVMMRPAVTVVMVEHISGVFMRGCNQAMAMFARHISFWLWSSWKRKDFQKSDWDPFSEPRQQMSALSANFDLMQVLLSLSCLHFFTKDDASLLFFYLLLDSLFKTVKHGNACFFLQLMWKMYLYRCHLEKTPSECHYFQLLIEQPTRKELNAPYIKVLK